MRGAARAWIVALSTAALCGVAKAEPQVPLPASAIATATLLIDRVGGSTRVGGVASSRLADGEMGEVALGAGVLAPYPEACTHGVVSAGPPGGPALEEGLGGLVGPGFEWRVQFTHRGHEQGYYVLGIEWSRRGRAADSDFGERSSRLDIRLRPGERRLIDHVAFTAPPGVYCPYEGFHVEVSADVATHTPEPPDLRYELWLARKRNGEVEASSPRQELWAMSAEEVDFRTPPLRAQLQLEKQSGGSVATLESRGQGTLRVWHLESGRRALSIDAAIHHRLRPGGLGLSSGSGNKTLEIEPGETLEIELLPMSASAALEAAPFGLSGTTADGVTLRGPYVHLDLDRLLGSPTYSLLLRVHEESR